MNWKNRFKNKVTLTSLILAVIAFIYQLCAVFGVVPKISQEMMIELAGMLINILVILGIVVDPNTDGITDKGEK